MNEHHTGTRHVVLFVDRKPRLYTEGGTADLSGSTGLARLAIKGKRGRVDSPQRRQA